MSRGPGRIERTIEAAFSRDPKKIWSVDLLCQQVWPDHQFWPEAKHRSAIRRAARNVAKRLGWRVVMGGGPRDRHAPLVIFVGPDALVEWIPQAQAYCYDLWRKRLIEGRRDRA
jgi:hypothetical protein